jgi:hypothetical protein
MQAMEEIASSLCSYYKKQTTGVSLRAEGEAISYQQLGDCFGAKSAPRNDT